MIDIEDMARRNLGDGLKAETDARMARALAFEIDLEILRISHKTYGPPRVRHPVTYKRAKHD